MIVSTLTLTEEIANSTWLQTEEREIRQRQPAAPPPNASLQPLLLHGQPYANALPSCPCQRRRRRACQREPPAWGQRGPPAWGGAACPVPLLDGEREKKMGKVVDRRVPHVSQVKEVGYDPFGRR